MVSTPLSQLQRRARTLKIVFSDVDGVLTDAGVYYSPTGEELKRFSMRDGMGVALLRERGIETAIMTQEDSPIVSLRSRKLGLKWVLSGVRDKQKALSAWALENGLESSQIAYMGDDVNDLGVLRALSEVSLTAAPADAVRTVKDCVLKVTEASGGRGAFREFADWILELRAEEKST